MTFNSFEYVFFFAAIIMVYWSLRSLRQQNILLLAASYTFYAAWDWRFLTLIIISTLVDYRVGLALPAASERRRKQLLLLSLGVNLGFLGFFKYFNFFIDSAATLLTGIGLQPNQASLQIILPVGISFYTFQTLSYTIDVYRGQMQPTRSLLNFALFVAFFPQLVAGPIERASRLLPQMEAPRRATPSGFETGLILILLGLFKKIVIADVAASLIEPRIFIEPLAFEPVTVMAAVYLFALQIYGDFSGYSDIARGSARLLGFELMENFNQPYFAQTVSEFWRRWHISLSSWFRDYVYIPVSNALKQHLSGDVLLYAIAVMITMLLSGLWHGANWTFVFWGGLLGLYQVVSRPLRGVFTPLLQHRITPVRFGIIALRILLTFHLILLAWVFFRTPEIAQVGSVYAQLWTAYTHDIWTGDRPSIRSLLLLYGVTLLIDLGQVITGEHTFTRRLPVPVRSILYAAALCAMIIFAVKPYVPFIYFQF